MGFLSGLTRSKSAPIEGRPWVNPELDAILDVLPVLGPGPAVDRALDYLRPRRFQVEEHVQAMDAFGDGLVLALDELRARSRRVDPQGEEAGDLLALLGRTLTIRAWQVRGSGGSSTVSRSSYETFGTLLEEADDVLIAALGAAPEHPAAAAFRLSTALGLGATSDEWWARLEAAQAVRSTLFLAHRSMLMGLCRKWYGSDRVMFEFGRDVAASAPAGDPVSAMLPLAHAEYLCSLLMEPPPRGPSAHQLQVQERAADLAAVAAASYRWCGDEGAEVPAHPYEVEAHNLFGWFLGLSREHQDRGRWHLAQAGNRMASAPWDYLSPGPVKAFRAMHAKLGIA